MSTQVIRYNQRPFQLVFSAFFFACWVIFYDMYHLIFFYFLSWKLSFGSRSGLTFCWSGSILPARSISRQHMQAKSLYLKRYAYCHKNIYSIDLYLIVKYFFPASHDYFCHVFYMQLILQTNMDPDHTPSKVAVWLGSVVIASMIEFSVWSRHIKQTTFSEKK